MNFLMKFMIIMCIYDYNVYLLYLANFGSQSDIGAKFAGFNYEGFDNQVHVK